MPNPPNALPPNHRLAYQDAIDYLYGRIDYERAAGAKNDYSFRLERTVELFEKLGLGRYLHRPTPGSSDDPKNLVDASGCPKVPVVHIAGTKGKGSTATMVSKILSTAGYRVGLYTSPHLTDLEERFRINGVPCRRESLIELVEIISPIVETFDCQSGSVSFFELTTAMAVLHFDRNNCDAMILEVGLGGRLDSTNVCASTLAAITSIGLDHQRVLGDTIGEIAAEKAGIIKAAVPVVSGVTRPAAADEIRRATARVGGELLEREAAFTVRDRREVGGGSEFVYCVSSDKLINPNSARQLPLFLSLVGAHQVDNAAIAISIVRRLFDILPVTDSQIAEGLRRVHCIGRLERFSLDAPSGDSNAIQIMIDTAHNHDSIVALCDAVNRRTASGGNDDSRSTSDKPTSDKPTSNEPESFDPLHRPIVAVFGTSRDKDLASMAAELTETADEVICTRFTTSPRFVDVDQLTEAFRAAKNSVAKNRANPATSNVHQQEDPHLALKEAIRLASPGGTVIVCGSFFLAGQLRPDVLEMPGAHPLVVGNTRIKAQ